MAKRRKKTAHRKTVHRRRRVSGIRDVDFTMIALTIGGAVAARILTNKLAASTNATMQKLAPYSGVILGVVIPMVTKTPMLKAISLGMVAGGGVSLLGPTGLKVISGLENTINGRMGYPYSAAIPIPFRKVSGVNAYGKANFSGSGKSQAAVISGTGPATMNGGGCGGGY